MIDDEFDTLFEAAYQEALNDLGTDADIDMTALALQAHSYLFEAYYSDRDVREGVTDLEMKRVEAMRQALSCYQLLHARKGYEDILALLNKTTTTALTEKENEDRANVLLETQKVLMSLDEVEPLARMTLAGLGLPTTIAEFKDYDGNRCRIKLNMDACTLASDSVFDKLQAALLAAAKK